MHEDVDAAKRFVHAGGHRIHLVGKADVGFDADGFGPGAEGFDLRERRLDVGLVDVHHGDVRAGFGHTQGRGPADAARSAGDDDGLVF